MSISAVVAEFTLVLADPTVSVDFGRVSLVRHERPPRITFVPVGGPVGTATEIGRRDLANGMSTRTLHERALRVDVYCWGRDFAEAETLLENTIVALRRTALGSYDLGAEEWLTETDDGQADLQYGALVTLETVLHLPVADALKNVATGTTDMMPLAKPAAQVHTGVFALEPIYGWTGLLYGGGSKYGGGRDTSC